MRLTWVSDVPSAEQGYETFFFFGGGGPVFFFFWGGVPLTYLRTESLTCGINFRLASSRKGSRKKKKTKNLWDAFGKIQPSTQLEKAKEPDDFWNRQDMTHCKCGRVGFPAANETDGGGAGEMVLSCCPVHRDGNLRSSMGCGSKLNNWGYACFSLRFHLPRGHCFRGSLCFRGPLSGQPKKPTTGRHPSPFCTLHSFGSCVFNRKDATIWGAPPFWAALRSPAKQSTLRGG